MFSLPLQVWSFASAIGEPRVIMWDEHNQEKKMVLQKFVWKVPAKVQQMWLQPLRVSQRIADRPDASSWEARLDGHTKGRAYPDPISGPERSDPAEICSALNWFVHHIQLLLLKM